MAVRYYRGAGRVGVKSSRSAPKGISPSLVFRNVFVCCDRKIFEGFTNKGAAFRDLVSRPFAYAKRRLAGRASALRYRARSARPWRAIALNGGSAKPCATLSIG